MSRNRPPILDGEDDLFKDIEEGVIGAGIFLISAVVGISVILGYGLVFAVDLISFVATMLIDSVSVLTPEAVFGSLLFTFLFYMLVSSLLNHREYRKTLRKKREHFDDLDDFDLRKEAYAEYLSEEENTYKEYVREEREKELQFNGDQL